jgi:hypothetical protein
MHRFGSAAFVFVAAVVMCILHTSDAPACGVAYPEGTFARFSDERSLIVWDAKHHMEHFVRALTLDGDPQKFGVFVPTPTFPVIEKEREGLIDDVAALFAAPPPEPAGGSGQPGAVAAAAPPPVQVLQRKQIGDFEAVTLKATDADALGAWLARNHFVDKPELRAWEKSYLDKKWLVTALRCTADGKGARSLEVPTLRFSFTIDAPFYPYKEVPIDLKDEDAYHARSGGAKGLDSRAFDLYVVAASPVRSMVGELAEGPPVSRSIQVSSRELAGALGDIHRWHFDPNARKTWTVTHFAEDVLTRTVQSDVTFASYVQPMETAPSPVDEEPGSSTPAKSPKKKLFTIGAIALFLIVAGAALFAVLGEDKK